MVDIHSGTKVFGTQPPNAPSAKAPSVSAPPTKTVPVFVRKGSYDGERVLSFTIPSDIPAKEIIRHGFAVDGNRAAAIVEWYSKVEDDRIVNEWDPRDETGAVNEEVAPDAPLWAKHYHLITQTLHEAELLLIDWLESRGYEVEFK